MVAVLNPKGIFTEYSRSVFKRHEQKNCQLQLNSKIYSNPPGIGYLRLLGSGQCITELNMHFGPLTLWSLFRAEAAAFCRYIGKTPFHGKLLLYQLGFLIPFHYNICTLTKSIPSSRFFPGFQGLRRRELYIALLLDSDIEINMLIGNLQNIPIIV